MASIISGPVSTVNISGGQFVAINEADNGWSAQKFILENIAGKATHDANNTGFELPKCYRGTRQAIQRDLTKWIEDVERKYAIYWLYAPAGAGKTAIAKTLADSFSNSPNRYLLASFFFRRASPQQNTEERFIATIAYQIKTNLPQTSRFVFDAIKEDAAIFQKDLRVQMDKLILDPLCKACEAVTAVERASWPRLLIIDGLDECSGHAAQLKILDVVSHLVCHMPFPLAIFLSCRPEALIRRAFQNKPLMKSSLRICLPDTYSSDEDLRNFFIGRFREVVNAHSHILKFPQDWPGKDVIDLLIHKSSGQFIYASTVMKYIDVQDDNPMERLRIVRGLEKSLDDENPFAELDTLYRHILSSVKPKHLPIVMRVLQVTLSLSDAQGGGFSRMQHNLASLLDLKPGELEYSLGNLIGVLVGTKQSTNRPAVEFYHASFTDFLLDESRAGLYFIDISLAHTQLIVRLVCYLLQDEEVSEIESRFTSFHMRSRESDDRRFGVTIAINTVLNRLPLADLTEELHQKLHCVTQAAQKVIYSCTRTSITDMDGTSNWEVIGRFASALGELAFDDAAILKSSFLHEAKKFISKELQKYEREPLCRLIPLFMMGCSICPSIDTSNPFVLSSFLIDGDPRWDRKSLNLGSSFRNSFWDRSDDWTFLRHLIKEIGYDAKPEAYTATCLCILTCLGKSSWQLITHDSLIIPLTEDLTTSIRPRNFLEVILLWRVFSKFSGVLLGRAAPSVELQKCLKENAQYIVLFYGSQ